MFAAMLPRAASRRLLLLLALLPACSVVNPDHCANLDGDATCQQRDPARPFCSQCAGDNNGCFAEVPADSCHAVTVAQPASSTSDPGTTTTPDPTTSGGSLGETLATTGTPDPVTTDATSSSTDTSSSTTTDDPATTSTTGTTTGDSSTTTDASSSSSGGEPVCGDNTIEGDEVCDGAMLDGQTCAKLLPSKWGGGSLQCTKTCKSFDDTACCIGVGQTCDYLLHADEECCPGLDCILGKCKVQ